MEFEISCVDFNATKFQVQKAIEQVLHGPDLFDPNDPRTKGRVPNFLVNLTASEAGGEHNGHGTLTLPSRRLGEAFATWLRDPANKKGITVLGRKLWFKRTKRRVWDEKKKVLENAPYISPEQEEKRFRILNELQTRLRVAKVQFGIWYRPKQTGFTIPDRAFSVEYQRDYTSHSAAYIEAVYDHKLLSIELGDRFTEEDCKFIKVKFTSIKKLGIGFDFGNPFIIFDLYTPPVFEEKDFNSCSREGIQHHKTRDRGRITALDAAHARVAPYTPHLRVILFRREDLLEFERLCHISQCEPRPLRVTRIDADGCAYVAPKVLYKAEQWIRTMSWPIAFQIEALLCNGHVHPVELLAELQRPVDDLIKQHGANASELLRIFSAELPQRPPSESAAACFSRVRAERGDIVPMQMKAGWFLCHHVTFTPTRMLLEGPYAAQSNRVIRQYAHAPDLLSNFVRVDFREEDRLSFRWNREVDGTYFLQSRVGELLKKGFRLGGKDFQFLAYSNSALKSHAVWFMSPFQDSAKSLVDAERIRNSIGDFGELYSTPSKLAARIGQAFTSTDPSVSLVMGQWEEMADIETEMSCGGKSCHTDGVGTISPELGETIWGVLCEASRSFRSNKVQPSAYQIRFLGYKGVVVIDERLKGRGVFMRLRPSQRKFGTQPVAEANLEIAKAFDYPYPVHLNRPIVMALEDRGVSKETFIELQELAKKRVYTAQDSLSDFLLFVRANNFGGKFHLAFVLECLELLGLDLTPRDGKPVIGSALFARLLRYAINNSLRNMKHRARIPVPGSYQLVGVADEGAMYIREGLNANDVFTLNHGQIFACVQETAESEPVYLKGKCVISRSPVVHPGDALNVFAVGKPPDGKFCFFKNLKNCVVLPVIGNRSMASCMGGGDLDGDVFDIYYKHPELQPTIETPAAEYPAVDPRRLPEGQKATVDDICDFVVEFINSDVLVSGAFVLILGTFDERCMTLAELCSRAVDYAKHGNPIDIDNGRLPHLLSRYKPDWHKAEIADPRDNDYYLSDRALGHLYRGVELADLNTPVPIPVSEPGPPLSDAISAALAPLVQGELMEDSSDDAGAELQAELLSRSATLFARYARELRYIRATHTLTDMAGVMLAEEEVILGVILSTCTQAGWRQDRVYRMKLHAEGLVADTRRRVVDETGVDDLVALRKGLRFAWVTWEWAQENAEKEGAQSFGLLVLGVVLDCLKKLNALPDLPPQIPTMPTPEEEWGDW
ncbi:RdRP-domain-containing protein [Vararia minispora EC-137]|uniref:RdRP-domain-containing protein n=1 Tax=Vararia minispora EC-137 TaxID=1314806 RepID=A0ACB8QBN4_9AGAM|nr:RdRP-domain-containing protein [Vararia minispora EC-137]